MDKKSLMPGISRNDFVMVYCPVALEILARMEARISDGRLAEVEYRELMEHRQGCGECRKESTIPPTPLLPSARGAKEIVEVGKNGI
jgi:hypothetical protein